MVLGQKTNNKVIAGELRRSGPQSVWAKDGLGFQTLIGEMLVKEYNKTCMHVCMYLKWKKECKKKTKTKYTLSLLEEIYVYSCAVFFSSTTGSFRSACRFYYMMIKFSKRAKFFPAKVVRPSPPPY